MIVSSIRTEKPKMSRATGTRQIGGIARIASRLAIDQRQAVSDRPRSSPRPMPIVPAASQPSSTTRSVWAAFSGSSPETVSLPAASATAVGAGRYS